MITLEQFDTACQSLHGYFGVVGIFGGNPCLHPQFAEICKILAMYFPKEQRGLWSNHPKGNGAVCRETFNPDVSNLNVHLDQEAQDEFLRDWPESYSALARLNGIRNDSRHVPPYVAVDDIEPDKERMWNEIASCDVNKFWSAMVCVVRGKVKGYFCELAGAQAMLHAEDSDWPDTGIEAYPGWWRNAIQEFENQIKTHCPKCGIPAKGYGSLAISGHKEQVSASHVNVFHPKRIGREVQLVSLRDQLGRPLDRATDYVGNGSPMSIELDSQPRTQDGIHGQIWTTVRETNFILDHIPDHCRFLELGSAGGGTCAILATARPNVKFFCVDSFREYPERLSDWVNNHVGNMLLLKMETTELIGMMDNVFDVVFVDAGHTYDECYSDLMLSLRSTKVDGKILVHDYADPNHASVKKATDDFCNAHRLMIKEVFHSIAVIHVKN